jgi:hypothetical protein
MPIGAVIVRVVASALLVGSGALSIAADYQRWWPACMSIDFDRAGLPEAPGQPL